MLGRASKGVFRYISFIFSVFSRYIYLDFGLIGRASKGFSKSLLSPPTACYQSKYYFLQEDFVGFLLLQSIALEHSELNPLKILKVTSWIYIFLDFWRPKLDLCHLFFLLVGVGAGGKLKIWSANTEKTNIAHQQFYLIIPSQLFCGHKISRWIFNLLNFYNEYLKLFNLGLINI